MTAPSPSSARGALIGALAGDAIGAYLEFFRRELTPGDVEVAMTLPGGGAHRVAPGQITDDGELTLCLARSLAGRTTWDPEPVARAYRDWMGSRPFDVGGTTATAFGPALGVHEGVAARMAAAAQGSLGSKANGAMMRQSGLGAWSWRLTPAEAAEAARADARLSHPNLSCQDSCAAYVCAIRHLVIHPGDAEGARVAARAVAQEPEVRGWLDDADRGALPPGSPMDGFVRIAFTHAMYHLRLRTPWPEAIRAVLAIGGDTDTNACIVGGLLGALHGEEAVPERAREALRTCDTSRGRPRPAWLSTRQVDALADQLAADLEG
jgi:ADP-ribosyl-[dinitrogen reductase] hydrolase